MDEDTLVLLPWEKDGGRCNAWLNSVVYQGTKVCSPADLERSVAPYSKTPQESLMNQNKLARCLLANLHDQLIASQAKLLKAADQRRRLRSLVQSAKIGAFLLNDEAVNNSSSRSTITDDTKALLSVLDDLLREIGESPGITFFQLPPETLYDPAADGDFEAFVQKDTQHITDILQEWCSKVQVAESEAEDLRSRNRDLIQWTEDLALEMKRWIGTLPSDLQSYALNIGLGSFF
jgi:hypothetical protein